MFIAKKRSEMPQRSLVWTCCVQCSRHFILLQVDPGLSGGRLSWNSNAVKQAELRTRVNMSSFLPVAGGD